MSWLPTWENCSPVSVANDRRPGTPSTNALMLRPADLYPGSTSDEACSRDRSARRKNVNPGHRDSFERTDGGNFHPL